MGDQFYRELVVREEDCPWDRNALFSQVGIHVVLVGADPDRRQIIDHRNTMDAAICAAT